MKKLPDTELYKLGISAQEQTNIRYATAEQLSKMSLGVITPDHIATELLQLKLKAKAGTTSLLGEAISLFENFNGRIRLFNLATLSGKSAIPPYMPFVVSAARNRAMESDQTSKAVSPAIFMNMYRVGNWNAEGTGYIGLSAITDLFTELESGLINYKLLVEGNSQKVLGDKKILESLTKIYTFMFNKAVIRSSRAIFSNDFMKTASEFLVANFFLKYVVEAPVSETISDYAYSATDGRASLASLKDFEKNASIDYTSLSGFLKTFGETIFFEEIQLNKFETSWGTIHGEGLILGIEYLPYLIHHLIGVVHGASLGGVTRLMVHKPELSKKGLDVFYRTITSILR